MSSRYQAGIVLPGYNALKVANAPTIGSATSASGTSASVAFTAPSCVGGGAISSYTVFACCGVRLATGASSPITVTGLTTGTTYTFKAIATNAFGPSYPSAASNSVTPVAAGQDAFTTAGTFSWVAPTGVTSVAVVVVGGGGGSTNGIGPAAGGGELRYKNNISVTPGNSYTVVVGVGGTGGFGAPYTYGTSGGQSYFSSTSTVRAFGGIAPSSGTVGGAGGSGGTGDGGGNGGQGGPTCSGFGRGGGGAGGYAGAGGNAGSTNNNGGLAGSGGGGGGGGALNAYSAGGGGGGVGILGQGSSGGSSSADSTTCSYGRAGSCGSNGANAKFPNPSSGNNGGAYGGGGGRGGSSCSGCNLGRGGNGGVGAVRIIYPGTTRSFPSTNTGNV